jgi:multidrug efflux pump subunit AcrB
MTPQDISKSLSMLLSGIPITTVRDGIEKIEVVARAAPLERLDLAHIGDLSLYSKNGVAVPLSQIAKVEYSHEEPILWRINRDMAITVRADVVDGVQPPDVTNAIWPKLKPIGASLALNIADRPFGFVALLGLIALAGMIMRNAVILVDQIESDVDHGLTRREAIVEATVRRARPVILTAMAAILAMIPLSRSAFWGPMAITIMGGLFVATFLTLLFLPSLYALWYRKRLAEQGGETIESGRSKRLQRPAAVPLAAAAE